MSKGVELVFDNDDELYNIYSRVCKLHKYLKCDGFTGNFEIAFLQKAGGLDDQDWDWVEDIELVKTEFNSLKK